MKPAVGWSLVSSSTNISSSFVLLMFAARHRPPAVVVRVVVAAPFRPARGQRLPARFAADVAAQRALARRGPLQPAVEDRLDAEENSLVQERFEVPTRRDAVIGNIDAA